MTTALGLALLGCLQACSQPKDTSDAQSQLDCRPQAELEAHQAYLDELASHYCPVLFSELAPPPPDGAEPLVTITHTNEALPNYLQYPDIDPMMGNTRRLSLIASCMHKRCLAAPNNRELSCRGSTQKECTDAKGTFLIDALISDISQVCKPNAYTLRRITSKLSTIFAEREKKSLRSCESRATTEHPDLALMLGGKVDSCSLERPDCPGNLQCIAGTRGNRCIAPDHAVHFSPGPPAPAATPSTSCGNGILDSGETCDGGDANGQPTFGAWCTSACQVAHCGDSILDSGEACECDLAYQAMFFEKPKLAQSFGSLGNCPGRFSITRGQERALGFQCHACQLMHPRHPREWRSNTEYLPEKDLTQPLGQPAQTK